jgi:hypothetical protein
MTKLQSFFALFIVVALGSRVIKAIDNMSKSPTQLAAEAKAETTQKALSRRQDEQAQATQLAIMVIRKSLRDPDSLIVDEAFTRDGKLICIQYRARNGFGGVNRSFAAVNVKLLATSFDAGYWNKNCTGDGFHDEISGVN